MERMEVLLAPAGGVMGLIEKPVVTPAGAPATDSVTGELKLLSEVTVTVSTIAAGVPCGVENVPTESPIEKSPAYSMKAKDVPATL
jgi:hypothetical protein